MKKVLYLIPLLLLLVSSYHVTAQVVIGNQDYDIDYLTPKEYEIGGITFVGAENYDTRMILLVAGLQVAPATPLYLETGLSYIEKGGKGGLYDSYSYNMNYLEVPLLIKYQYNFDYETSIQPFVGVYGALGVSGKIKDQDQRQIYNSFADDAFKRLDGGLRIGCGLQYDYLYAELGYDFGLANVSRDDFDTAHTGCFFANIGINF